MIKLFKTTLLQKVVDKARLWPSLIELHTVSLEYIRIGNGGSLNTPNDQPSNIFPITPFCFLDKRLLLDPPYMNLLIMEIYDRTKLTFLPWLIVLLEFVTKLQGRKKLRATGENHFLGQLVLRQFGRCGGYSQTRFLSF